MPRLAPRSRSAQRPALFNFAPPVNSVPVIQLFGDIGASEEEDWFWGDEGGAGTFKEFCNKLAALGDVPELRVEIHSYGGDVCVGKAIHDRLAEHPADKTAVIYGVCASAATYPALACQTIQIPANSFFLIHNSTGICLGEASDMRRSADNLDICDESIANLYVARTGKTLEEIRDIMDADTWMSGEAAVEMGLATEVIDPITVEPSAKIKADNFRNEAIHSMPREARVWFDTRRSNSTQRHLLNRPSTNHPPVTMKNTVDPSAPVEAPTPAPAPAPAAPPAEVVTPPPAEAPSNISNLVTAAVTAAVKPLNDEITNMKLRLDQGVTVAALPGAQPAENVVQPGSGPAQKEMKRADWRNLGAHSKAEFFRNGGKLID